MSFERQIQDQPARLRALAQRWLEPSHALRSPDILRLLRSPRLLLTGMGSSLYACYPAYLRLARAAWPVALWETAELLHFVSDTIDQETVVVAVSQSGETAEIVSLLERLPRSQPVVGVTNVTGSTLAQRADVLLELGADPGPYAATQTYLNSVASLLAVARATLNEDMHAFAGALDQAAGILADLLGQSFSRMDLAIEPGGHLVFLARGPSLASAQESALLFQEVTGRGAAALSGPGFRHGPLETAGPDLRTVIFIPYGSTTPLMEGLASDLANFGARVLRIADVRVGKGDWRHEPVEEELAPLVNIAPIQVLAWRAAMTGGREPGTFRQASSITRSE